MKFCTHRCFSVLSPLLLTQLGGDLGGSPVVRNFADFLHLCLLSLMDRYIVKVNNNLLLVYLQIGGGFGAPPAAVPPTFSAPVSGGLDDLFDLGGGVGMPMGAYSPPKTVSFGLAGDILLNNINEMVEQHFSASFYLGLASSHEG